jgi:hypothetical protein
MLPEADRLRIAIGADMPDGEALRLSHRSQEIVRNNHRSPFRQSVSMRSIPTLGEEMLENASF